jgi:hypothetical protein
MNYNASISEYSSMYQEIRIWEKLAENEFEKLMKKYSVIINKYKYISTALLEMIYPSFL